MSNNNKVKFNLKNVHYALLTLSAQNVPSFGKPVAIPGAVSLSLDANGEPENFYADGVVYYVINNNMGYDGDLEVAMIPESFRTDVLKEELDENGVLIENSESELTAIRSTSAMCFITAQRPAPPSRARPTRTARKSRLRP